MKKNELIKKLYWIQFILFFISQLIFINADYIRIITIIIQAFVISLIVINKYKYKVTNIILFNFILCAIILDVIISRKLNVHMIYWLFSYLIIINLDVEEDEIIKLLNNTCIIYLILSIFLNYTSLRAISIYAEREFLQNKFLSNINRFLGIEGTPAGPDILFILVLYINIFRNRFDSKLKKYILFFISIIVIIWTSSLSPIVGIVISIPILILSKNNKFICNLYTIILLNYNYIIAIIYNRGDENLRLFLNKITTWRANLWGNILNELRYENSVVDWILGRKELIEVAHIKGTFTNNPHSIGLFILQFLGIFGFVCINLFIITKILKIKNSSIKIILISMMIYMNTNTFPLTIRGNPIFLYIFIYYLNYYKLEEEVNISENSIHDTST